jgi:hypothetical protein
MYVVCDMRFIKANMFIEANLPAGAERLAWAKRARRGSAGAASLSE